MKLIGSILEIIDRYDNFIIDQWGVMHDGKLGYRHAIEAINHLEKNKKKLIIISNSSKRKISSANRLPSLGFKKNSFVEIITSGEMIWNTLKKIHLDNIVKKKCFHIFDETKEDGLLFRDGLNLDFTEKIDDAELILACTPFAGMLPIDYIPMLNLAYEKKLIMYCANPDFETVENTSNKNIFCMGSIAEIYKKMGGKVIIQGKPEIYIYKESTKNINLVKSRTVAIGDSIFHDIKGANNFSIDSILIKSGIHKDLDIIKKIIDNHKIYPTYLLNNFNI